MFTAHADWTFILPLEFPAKDLHHVLRSLVSLHNEHSISYKINGFSDVVHRPDSKVLEDKKHDVSETGPVSVVR
jgi:hypothetical protein